MNLHEYCGDDPVNGVDPSGDDGEFDNGYVNSWDAVGNWFNCTTPAYWVDSFEHNDLTRALKMIANDASYIPLPEDPVTDARVAEFVGEVGVQAAKSSASTIQTAVVTGTNAVYRSVDRAGNVNYVGITKNLIRRGAEHLRAKGITIAAINGLSKLSREDARAVEQVLIEKYKLPKDSGNLLNQINSIAKTNPKYAAALTRGAQLLRQVGYPGF